MPVHAPITRATHVCLRAAVIDLKEGEDRRHFPVTIRSGLPGVASHAYVVSPGDRLDQGLRADLAGALVQRARLLTPVPLLWLTRPGRLVLHDADALWSAASRAACAEAGLPCTFVVVTRDGWFDPVTGVRREWRRLRRRSAAPPGPTG